ncbi:N-acetylmuramoyl-L-alanine amidase [Fundidesulfovibrio butyratiphilus]
MRQGLLVFLCICLTACLLLGRAEQAVSASSSDQTKSKRARNGKSSTKKSSNKKSERKKADKKEPSDKKSRTRAPSNTRNASKTKSPRTKASPPADQDQRKALSALTLIKRVEQVSGKDYSRIVVSLSGETPYHYQLLPPDPKSGNVRRIYVDIEDSRLSPRVPSNLKVSSGLMRRVRVSPFKPGVIRVVVEVENLRSWKVFTLQDPFRVVVDVQGEETKAASTSKRSRRSKGQSPAKQEAEDKAEAAQAEVCAQAEKKRAANPRYKLPPACRKMAKKLVEQLGLTVSTVMVDAGHGGKDPGAQGKNGLREKNVVLRLAKMVGDRLSRAGITVLYTRTADRFVPLENRTGMANARKADLFLSIHCNASPDPTAHGLETYSLNLATTAEEVRVAARENAVDPKRISDMRDLLADLMLTSRLKESRDFARSTHQGAVTEAKKNGLQRDRGLHEAPFYVLMGANMPAVLVEVGYITNPAEAEKLNSRPYLEKLAEGIADGVLAYKAKLDHKTGG